ncbi:MAG: hypothetical protein S4CHLAM27_00940 [Chlamydiia bacterium]|nr:hypothetical protein [Chlamydiia bacterium]
MISRHFLLTPVILATFCIISPSFSEESTKTLNTLESISGGKFVVCVEAEEAAKGRQRDEAPSSIATIATTLATTDPLNPPPPEIAVIFKTPAYYLIIDKY